jgi:hypothetical protein
VTARIRTDALRSLRHQRQDLHQSTYPISLGRSGLILLSKGARTSGPAWGKKKIEINFEFDFQL